MTRFILVSCAAVAICLALAVSSASAQFTYPFRPPQYGPYYQTQLSPYLQMLRAGDPAVNFYAGVLPEVQRRQDRNAIYGSLQGLSLQIPAAPGITNQEGLFVPLVSTGHPTAFNNTGTFFGAVGMARPISNPFAQQRRGMLPGGRGVPGTGMMGPGSRGVWPNMRPGMPTTPR